MIRLCHEHQWPSEHGRPFIPDPSTHELFEVTPQRFEPLLWPAMEAYNTHCDRCGCDHGTTPREVPPP